MRRQTIAALCAAAAIVLLGSGAVAEGPIDRAQTLRYRVAWNGLPAANATVSIRPDEIGGEPVYAVETTARTNSFIDLFYAFRGSARVIFGARNLTPRQFNYDRRIRGVHSVTTIEFYPQERRARSVYIKRGVTKMQLDLDSANLVDPITAVFQARHGPSEIGVQTAYEIFTGESRYRVALTIDGREEIDVPAGKFPALRVSPKIWKIRGDEQPPDPRLRHATIWVSDDTERLLLRIRSEVFIGAVTLDLLSREVAS